LFDPQFICSLRDCASLRGVVENFGALPTPTPQNWRRSTSPIPLRKFCAANSTLKTRRSWREERSTAMLLKPLPSIEELQATFYEDPPGVLRWKKDCAGAKAGDVAGTLTERGYRRIKLHGRHYRRTRLIWKMHHEEDPKGEINHINGDTANDRIENLRRGSVTFQLS
jgi:HNH endonuclease